MRYFNSQTQDGLNSLTPAGDEEVLRACVISGLQSAKEMIDDVLTLLLNPVHTLAQGYQLTSYFWKEYKKIEGATGINSVPINAGVTIANMATPIILKAKEAIQEEIHHLQCYNDQIRANILCQFFGRYFYPSCRRHRFS